jgi:hypothetical protein
MPNSGRLTKGVLGNNRPSPGDGPIGVKIAGKGGVWPFVSWSGLARPPTSCSAKSIKVMGGWTKPGHDTSGKACARQLI